MSVRLSERQDDGSPRVPASRRGSIDPGRRAALLVLALIVPAVARGGEDTVILENAAIWTGDAARPWAEAMALEGDRILSVGSRSEVEASASEGAVRIDLRGAFVCPGLVDAHAHVVGFGRGLTRVDLTGAASLTECLERTRRGVEERRERKDSGWVLGRGWDQNDWPVTRFPARADLDGVSGDLAVALTRIDGHALWVNTRALSLAGITRETPDPPGGRIHRDAEGDPTGILIDNAMDLVRDVVPEPGLGEDRESIRRAAGLLIRSGMTGVHDMGMSVEQAGLYREMARAGELEVRIYGALYSTDPGFREAIRGGPDREWVGGTFRLGMVKFFMDGALGSRGAALIEPYSDDPENRGLLLTDPDTLRATLMASLSTGFQCAVHAIGDRGNRLFLDTWASLRTRHPELFAGWDVPGAPLSALGETPASLPPGRLEHAQILHPGDIARVGAMGILASMQPTHCTSDMPWAPERLGPERLAGAYAWRTIVDGGAILAAGSDFPVESHDPRLGLYAAVTRRMPDGTPRDGWSPEERLAREEALAAFTAAPAYASGSLHELGTLTRGKLADFAVFDRNLVTCDPEAILAARTWTTVVGGRVAWLDSGAPFSGSLGEVLGEGAR